MVTFYIPILNSQILCTNQNTCMLKTLAKFQKISVFKNTTQKTVHESGQIHNFSTLSSIVILSENMNLDNFWVAFLDIWISMSSAIYLICHSKPNFILILNLLFRKKSSQLRRLVAQPPQKQLWLYRNLLVIFEKRKKKSWNFLENNIFST